MAINERTTEMELAAVVSQALEAAGVEATLSGGGAVSMHTDNQYQSKDLDFVTAERREVLSAALEPLGFVLASDRRHFTHPATDLFLEFPAAPLAFGNRVVQQSSIPKTGDAVGSFAGDYANTMCDGSTRGVLALERPPVLDQAVMVVRSREVDFEELYQFAEGEGEDANDIVKLREQAARQRR